MCAGQTRRYKIVEKSSVAQHVLEKKHITDIDNLKLIKKDKLPS